ncbi:MAG: cell wall-binding repeat-containing protein [Catenulispora sp.]|nr:cell wall-binding repeat-containing protein [Catenulispora sp.]
MSVRGRIRAGAALAATALAALSITGGSSTAHAAPAYQNGFIVYGTGGGWYEVGYDGSNLHLVSGGDVVSVAYSQDGQKVAYITWDHESHEVQVFAGPVAGGVRYLGTNQQVSGLGWTADGSKIIIGGLNAVPVDGPWRGIPGDSCGDLVKRVTMAGYVFVQRQCPEDRVPYLAMSRPGDATLTNVSPHSDAVVSPDGTRLAWLVRDSGTSLGIVAQEVGGHDQGYRVTTITGGSDSVRLGGFGPDGGIVYSNTDLNGVSSIRTVADAPGATPRTVISGIDQPGTLQAVSGPSNLLSRPAVDRVGGADRIGTAIWASRWAFDGAGQPGRRAATAVLARSDTFPDALTGTALATQTGGPLLLTPGHALDPGVGAELTRILPAGATVYLLGGPDALSPAVADAVRALGFTPARLGGADRSAPAAAVATAIAGPHPTSVLLATGADFPDALTAGVAAGQQRYQASGGGVVLLTDGRTMPPATRAYLDALTQPRPAVYAVGGPAATALRSAYPQWTDTVPLVGADRYGTAAAVATSALYGTGAPPIFGPGTGTRYTTAAVATGLNFPDALSAGALAGSRNGPLLLAGPDGLTAQEIGILTAAHVSGIVVAGGPAAVSPQSLTNTANGVFGPNNWSSFTNRTAPPLR